MSNELTEDELHQIARNKLSRSTLVALEKTDWKDGIDIQVLRTETLQFLRAVIKTAKEKGAEAPKSIPTTYPPIVY